jgi:hypothetical protein
VQKIENQHRKGRTIAEKFQTMGYVIVRKWNLLGGVFFPKLSKQEKSFYIKKTI